MDEQVRFRVLGNAEKVLLDRRHRGEGLPDFDELGVFLYPRDQIAHFPRHGRRKKHRLPLLGDFGDDGAHRVDEAHVEHPVRFVKDQKLDMRKVDAVSLQMVEQASGRCDDDVDALPEAR